LHHTAIWDDVVIGAGCALDGCVVGDGVVVPSGAAFTGCMLVPASACGKEFLPYLRGDFVAVPFP
jgi:acetyltransferase-like isoleucine patch superfamily enzyme